ncbi:hypothetical protein HBI56_235570 [Parastagonospora nodorum]|uniref:C3H1-type domain-containing protein n=1 Tax=Phaeosphaeria nodorum (strain SN15 / ATCC MYA-4574 / FGSC 10173) TaxID=321614 RepID=A0A7U2I102_PHANO|nr:hypothetical protein HBH56_228240 [Parastagonospora nodorum]QRC95806.1 hypothetical protein JI435_159570 [Parastagonospora nodorum SN15]KAH3921677.1 hypothetical protein HBH54_234520 [Parastagonospora nodorum]KAH3938940.1 hypothetical protein HBH53_243000 [Parastagonospora nodorum]KAH3959094.1 hypothetical protein HBH51_204050 [Parastagonospora nodorum]
MRTIARNLCYQFQNNGFCTYGAKCKFPHTDGTQFAARRPLGKRQRAPPFKLKKAEENSNAIGTFFSQYLEFDYNYENGVAEEFYRMCDFFNWERDDGEREEARRAFKDAMVVQFNALYGTDITKIENWHRLCVAVCIEPLPTTIAECKEEIKNIHVNLVDLVDTSSRKIELFASLEDLKVYTIGNGKYFPKESAYAGGVLKFLLREILS